jgi:hypothetical protein
MYWLRVRWMELFSNTSVLLFTLSSVMIDPSLPLAG